MNLKIIILIFNALYLIVAIIWAIIDKSFETILAVLGGFISFITFFVANNNTFSVNVKQGKKSISVIGNVKKSHIGHKNNSNP